MGRHHGHPHADRDASGAATATSVYRRRLVVVLSLTLAVAVVSAVGGLAAGSLALLADAVHMLSDAAGVGAAVFASFLAARPPTSERTYGLQRAEILAAAVNAVVLAAIAVVVMVEAVRRWSQPPEVAGGLMLAVAVLGAAANLVGVLLLHRGARHSLNVRGAYLEVLGDLLGSVAVITAAVVIALTGWTRADALASLAIGLLIVPRALGLLRDVVDVLLEATPRGVDLDEVREHIAGVRGVVGVHDLHAWTITSGVPVLSAHVVVDEDCIASGRSGVVLDALGDCLRQHFDVAHCTFQLEPVGHRDHEAPHHA